MAGLHGGRAVRTAVDLHEVICLKGGVSKGFWSSVCTETGTANRYSRSANNYAGKNGRAIKQGGKVRLAAWLSCWTLRLDRRSRSAVVRGPFRKRETVTTGLKIQSVRDLKKIVTDV